MCCKIYNGMYGLPQAGIIAQELLQERLAKVGYHQSKIIPSLLTHVTRKKCFTVIVDDFTIKYTNMDNAKHLINVLTPSQLTRMQPNTLDSQLNGTMSTAKFMLTCRDTAQRHYCGSKTQCQRKNKTLRIHTLSQNMEPKPSMQWKKTIPPSSKKKK